MSIEVIISEDLWSIKQPCQHIQFFAKSSVITGRTCLVIVRVVRVLPVVAPVADRSVKNRIEVIESAT